MTRSTQLIRYSVLALAASTLMACNDNNNPRPVVNPPAPPVGGMMPPTPPATPVVTPDTFVLTSGNKLVGFAAATPANTVTVNLAIPTTETLLGGDFRAADRALYVLTRENTSNALVVYTANTTNGQLSNRVALVSNGMGGGVGATLAGAAITSTATKLGVDFNPLANALRIVDNAGLNLRTTLAAGNNTFIDAPVSTGLTENAYTNTYSDTCFTDLFHINATQLLLSAAPNGVTGNAGAGARVVGNLGVTADANSGFDVRTAASGSNTLTAALKVDGVYGLYTISSDTGAATRVGNIGGLGSENVLGLTANLPTSNPARTAGNAFAVTAGATQNLLTFNRPPQGSPNRLCTTTAITGLATGDVIVGGDTRPVGGVFTALTKNGTIGKLYSISTAGVASDAKPLAVSVGGAAVALSGTDYSVDFNPVPDRLRVIGDDGQNLRINPADGVTIVDTALTTAGGTTARTGVSAAAYTNSFAGGSGASLTTTLFAVDSATDQLVRIGANPANGTAGDPGNPNSGVVNNVGPLGVDITGVNAFEINATNNTALLAATTAAAVNTLFTVNLGTGVATRVQDFASPVVALGSVGAQAATVFGLTTAGNLVSFSPAAPGTVTPIGTGPITGLTAGDTLVGLDFRPSIGRRDNQLVALASAANGVLRLYAVNPATAAATLIAPIAMNPADTTAPFYSMSSGTRFGVDFNPVPDALRSVSNTAENLRTVPDNGLTFADVALDAAAATSFGAAYTNNFTTTAATELYYLVDANGANTTVRKNMGNPNDGVTQLVGDTGTDYSAVGDFDIAGGANGFALAALQPAAGGGSTLFRVNLTTGALTSVGPVATANTEALVGIAVRLQ